MNILQVINNLELAGAERLLHDLCLEFQRRGIRVSVFLLNATGSPFEKRLRDHAVPVFSSGVPQLHSPVHALRLSEHLRRHRYGIVHAHLFPTQLWTAMARRWSSSSARFIASEHSFTTRRRRRFARPFDAWLYGQFDAVCCVSEAAAASFLAWLPEYRDRTLAIPNGFDTHRFAERQAHDVKRTRILSVGRCEQVKRHEELFAHIGDDRFKDPLHFALTK